MTTAMVVPQEGSKGRTGPPIMAACMVLQSDAIKILQHNRSTFFSKQIHIAISCQKIIICMMCD